MDQSYRALQGQFSGKQPLQWSAVNRPVGYISEPDDEIVNGIVNVKPVPNGLPFISPLSTDFTFAVPDLSHPETPSRLPKPTHILKSQVPAKPCLVCGRPGCTLVSHKHFATTMTERRKNKQPTLDTSPLGPQNSKSATSPYLRFPVVMDAESHQLLALWSQDWGRLKRGPERHLFPTRWIDTILSTATAHAPLFQTLLATSGAFWALAHNPLDEVAPRHLQTALQMLAQTCNDERSASTDECVLASILFTLIYLAQGNGYEAERQFSVLLQVVQLRGGPHYLGLSGTLAELLLYADYVQAIFFDRAPSFKMPLPALKVGIKPRLGSDFRKLLPSAEFDPDLFCGADSLCRATDIFEHPLMGHPEASSAMNSFSYLSSISEYQLARCNIMFQGSGDWNECICLALLLFNSVVLRNHGGLDAPTQKLEYRFWTAVEATVTRGGFRDVPPCLLLWLLMTGLTTCIFADSKYRMNAVEKMRAANMSAAIHGWDQFRIQVLDQHLWMQAVQEDIFRDVWQEVEGYRAVIRSSTIR